MSLNDQRLYTPNIQAKNINVILNLETIYYFTVEFVFVSLSFFQALIFLSYVQV